MTPPYTVGVVVDPEFGERLEALAARMHVWVVDSSANRAVAKRIWASGTTALRAGVTIFAKGAATDDEALLLSVLESVDLHHGVHSHHPPYSTLEVVGVNASPVLWEGLAELGFKDFAETPTGFRGSK